eukprot:TRINITY_DN646_c2_g1_i2.p1 TRINITY_DN646_c2_g1~~TRINITY_DN646_c2_g1_i2.p1  ORF type:complete len:453 (-),score=85.44 TRINITY_DN646_c2_g1_i2:94-1452(-)
MHHFKTLFTSERQPKRELDVLVSRPCTDTIVVLIRNQFYLLEMKDNGRLLTTQELELQLYRIKEDAKSREPPKHSVGVFTTLDRESWADIRASLRRDQVNREIMEEIEKCFIVLVLDSHSPANPHALMALTAASGIDRWYDKIFNLIVYENSKVAALLEHTPCDAPIITSWTDDVSREIWNTNPDVPLLRPISTSRLPTPTRLDWNLSAQHLQQLDEAYQKHRQVEVTKDYHALFFEDYGTSFLKEHKMSPDTYVQLALQLAYYKLHQETPATYESAHTRMFKHGRTECVRTQSVEIQKWVEAMGSTNVPVPTKHLLLLIASDLHKKMMKEAVSGKGIDRHLFGMKLVSLKKGDDEPLPAIYGDKAMALSLHHKLSTSNVPGSTLYGGFGNVVPDGYGACYVLKKERIDVSICSDHTCPNTSSAKFASSLTESFREMAQLLVQIKKIGASKL